MAAIVCHGLQSCLDSQLLEPKALSFSFPFSPKYHQNPIDSPFRTSFSNSLNPKSRDMQQNNNKSNVSNAGVEEGGGGEGGWSFLQALSNVSKESSKEKENSVYVHPQAKPSWDSMSRINLELCTEKLGNETGSDIVETYVYRDMDLSSSRLTGEQNQTKPREDCLGEIRKMKTKTKAKAKAKNFPPPLTTISGSESLKVVRSYREDGSLVMKAIRGPPSTSCFESERSNGRLRLCFLKNSDLNFDPEDAEEANNGGDEDDGIEEGSESDGKYSERQSEQVEESDSKEQEETEEGEEIVKKEYESPRRCKEGWEHENSDLLSNWEEPVSVAIS